MDALTRARPPGLLQQLGAGARDVVHRLLGVGVAAYGKGGAPVSPAYPVDASERAFLANPWVWACYHAIASDLSGLPLVAETGVGVERVQTADHWLLALLASPHPKVSGRRWRKQIVADLLGGNAYVRVWRDPTTRRPVQLGRIPPALVSPIVAIDGEEVGWRIQGRPDLAWDDVLHISDISLSAAPDLVMGSSPIQPLALGLQVDRDARRHAGRSAKRGQLEMILSPDTPGLILDPDRTAAMTAGYTQSRENGDGVYIVNTGMKAQPTTLTARDGEFLGISDRLRAEVLATFGVPETRVGSPAANYGTAREQSRIYWQTLQARAALIDDEISRLAEPGVRIRHSFAGVDALQISQSERQQRAIYWKSEFGLEPSSAAAYEGFVDLPVPVETAGKTAGLEATALNGAQVASAVAIVQAVAEKRLPRDSGIAMLRVCFQMSAKDAEAVMGSVGRSFFVEPAVKSVPELLSAVLAAYEVAPDPSVVLPVVEQLLTDGLVALGVQAGRAALVAGETAATCHEAVAMAAGPLRELRAFGPDNAQRIARLAGLEAA